MYVTLHWFGLVVLILCLFFVVREMYKSHLSMKDQDKLWEKHRSKITPPDKEFWEDLKEM